MSRVISSLPSFVSRDALELLDVHRGEHVLLQEALGEEDRVLEVVALPRHERDDHVLAERELAHLRRGPVAMTSPFFTRSPGFTMGFWLMQVFWFDRWYLMRL